MPLSSASRTVHAAPQLAPLERLLVAGAGARIALDARGVNRYGFAPVPDPGLLALGSCTASPITTQAYAAAEGLHARLAQALQSEPAERVYARELERVRQELVRACGLSDLAGLEVVMAASGTDAHLIASRLIAAARPLLVVMVDGAETGSGVPLALAARHFSRRAALGVAVAKGASINAPGESATASIEVVSVPLRHRDGMPRPSADIDAEFAAWVHTGCARGQHVLLVSSDISKSGMLAPSPACAIALLRSLPQQVDVLVDACQFRIGKQTLRAYLEQGCMAALTGSKFLSGPPFSGALLLPEIIASGLRKQPVPHALRDYSAAADWPRSWDTQELGTMPNLGLLLRWEAALSELRTFREVADADITDFLRAFSHAVRHRLERDDAFAPLPVPEIERRGLGVATGWDVNQTIYPFLLFHANGAPLQREQTLWVYRMLQSDMGESFLAGKAASLARLRCQAGQPMACGERDGMGVSALRLCVSARLIVQAVQAGKTDAVIAQAMATLDKAAWLASVASGS